MNRLMVIGSVVLVSTSLAGCCCLDRRASDLHAQASARTLPKCKARKSLDICTVNKNAPALCEREIKIEVENGVVYVSPRILEVKRNMEAHGNKKARIVWSLATPNAEFRAGEGDGIFVTDHPTDKQVEDAYISDRADASQKTTVGRHYHIRFTNSKPDWYEYAVQFHVGNQKFACDPTINNEGSN